jgi:hypothetical protein
MSIKQGTSQLPPQWPEDDAIGTSTGRFCWYARKTSELEGSAQNGGLGSCASYICSVEQATKSQNSKALQIVQSLAYLLVQDRKRSIRAWASSIKIFN